MSSDTFNITVTKGNRESFGITLLGEGPSIVSDIAKGSPAAFAGVQPGFVVVEVDGENVIRKHHKVKI